MPNQLGSYLPPPTKQRFAGTFRTVSRFSFWIQLVLGAISVIALLLAIFSRNLSVQTNNAGIGFGIFLATGLTQLSQAMMRLHRASRQTTRR